MLFSFAYIPDSRLIRRSISRTRPPNDPRLGESIKTTSMSESVLIRRVTAGSRAKEKQTPKTPKHKHKRAASYTHTNTAPKPPSVLLPGGKRSLVKFSTLSALPSREQTAVEHKDGKRRYPESARQKKGKKNIPFTPATLLPVSALG